jgi:excisionase family DNA binding protein
MGQIEPVLVDTETARRMLGVGKTVLFRLLAENKLRRVKLGSKTLVPVQSIREFAASLQEAA